jgi:putative tryptophan/tyrosine transport system substrate-binding protein
MRRGLICIALAGILTAIWTAGDCRASKALIAAVLSSDQPRYREAHRSFVKTMDTHGYSSASTDIILQSPNPDALSWSNAIRKCTVFRPDLIVAYGAPAAQVAAKESKGIPVVSVDMYVSEQLISGYCGVSCRVPLLMLLKTVQNIHPSRRVGVIYSSREVGSFRQMEDIRKYCVQLGMQMTEGNVDTADALDTVLASMLDSVDVIVTTESSVAARHFSRIISRARARRIPVAATMPEAADKGALVSLEINPREQGQMAAEIAVRILEGASPSSLPLLTPHRIDLVINQRAAREIGMEVPIQLLGTASRIIR